MTYELYQVIFLRLHKPNYKPIKLLKHYEKVYDDYRHDGNNSLHDGG